MKNVAVVFLVSIVTTSLLQTQALSTGGHVVIQLRMLQYDNPTGTSYYGKNFTGERKCCDSVGSTACTSPGTDLCDPYFIFCIGKNVNGRCSGALVTNLQKLRNVNQYSSGPSLTIGTQVTLTSWRTNDTELISNVLDDDVANPDLVDNFTTTLTFPPDIGSFTATKHVIQLRHHVSLDLELAIWCQSGYTGEDCTQPCNGLCSSYPACPVTASPIQEIDILSLRSGAGAINPVAAHTELLHFMADYVCPSNTSTAGVTVLGRLRSGLSFVGQCDKKPASKLKFAEMMYVLNIAYTSTLTSLFTGLPWKEPLVTYYGQKTNVLALMMVRVVHFEDTAVNRSSLPAVVDFIFCYGRSEDNICNGLQMKQTVKPQSSCYVTPTLYSETPAVLVYLSTWPEKLLGQVRYDGRGVWNFQHRLLDLVPGKSFAEAQPEVTVTTYATKSLTVEVLLWCGGKKFGRRCGNTCPSALTPTDCANCKPGHQGPGCTSDIDECQGSPCQNAGTCRNTAGSFSCVCPAGWTGRTCTIDVDECKQTTTCNNADACVNTQGGYTCMCKPGFQGATCEADIDECRQGNPCQQASTCFNTWGSYYCLCRDGFRGDNCSMSNFTCGNSHGETPGSGNTLPYCLNGGTCTVNGSAFQCGCLEDWMGERCQQRKDRCLPMPCLNNGTCINTPGGFQCHCDSLWGGDTCEKHVNACLSNPCRNGGICSDTGSGFTCGCGEHWQGDTCEKDVDECLSAQCLNGGTCINSNGGFSCSCTKQWTGAKCETDVNECTLSPCLHGGTCLNTNGSFTCKCSSQWKGDTCEIDVNECLSSPCLHGGTCLNTNGSFTCKCSAQWKGNTCEIDVDECLSSPCIHGGTCTNTVGNFSCSCTNQWHGQTCSIDVDECTMANPPCLNNGKCINSVGSYTCQCPDQWTGVLCETDVNECLVNPCMNSGTCSNTNGGFVCKCTDHWQGSVCADDVNECLTNPCLHEGNCSNTDGSFRCNCPKQWQGPTCQDDVNECLSKPCANGGTCINTDGSYTCQCPNQWQGPTCTVDVNECLSRPCANGGTCINIIGSYRCQCPNQWQGQGCRFDVNECHTNPCFNTGTCLNTNGGFTCSCNEHWTGDTCNNDVNECVTSPCLHGGTCTNSIGGFSCDCTASWKGDVCNISLPSTTSSAATSKYHENTGTRTVFSTQNTPKSLSNTSELSPVNPTSRYTRYRPGSSPKTSPSSTQSGLSSTNAELPNKNISPSTTIQSSTRVKNYLQFPEAQTQFQSWTGSHKTVLAVCGSGFFLLLLILAVVAYLYTRSRRFKLLQETMEDAEDQANEHHELRKGSNKPLYLDNPVYDIAFPDAGDQAQSSYDC